MQKKKQKDATHLCKGGATVNEKKRYMQRVEGVKRGRRGIDTYLALLLSSSQPLDWPDLGWALLSRWGRATQNHMPKEWKTERKEEERVERKVHGRV